MPSDPEPTASAWRAFRPNVQDSPSTSGSSGAKATSTYSLVVSSSTIHSPWCGYPSESPADLREAPPPNVHTSGLEPVYSSKLGSSNWLNADGEPVAGDSNPVLPFTAGARRFGKRTGPPLI